VQLKASEAVTLRVGLFLNNHTAFCISPTWREYVRTVRADTGLDCYLQSQLDEEEQATSEHHLILETQVILTQVKKKLKNDLVKDPVTVDTILVEEVLVISDLLLKTLKIELKNIRKRKRMQRKR
jgi:hypothetical protein